MRVDKSFLPTIESHGGRPEWRTKADTVNTLQRDEFTSSTADLMSLIAGSRGSANIGREEVIQRLKTAYESGAIRPDANRIAAAILRFESDGAGEVA